jgi:endonuclease/exonuclease/phosphatase family metal-dependent hydrolase
MRVASINWENGGITASGDDAPWRTTVDVLVHARPHIVLAQEFTAPDPGVRLGRHLRRTANTLGMEPILGPIVPGARTALHTAIFVDTRTTGLRIDDVPYLGEGFGGIRHPWCHVELGVPGLPQPLHLYSVHLPARSAPAQLSETYSLTAAIAQQPQLVLAGGDFNTYPRGGPAPSSEDLAHLPGHLQVTRCHGTAGGLEANYDVDDLLTGRGKLIDIAPHLPAQFRQPPGLTPTADDGVRLDRFYASPQIAAAVEAYQVEDIGSDHRAVLVELNTQALTSARGPHDIHEHPRRHRPVADATPPDTRSPQPGGLVREDH